MHVERHGDNKELWSPLFLFLILIFGSKSIKMYFVLVYTQCGVQLLNYDIVQVEVSLLSLVC